MVKIQINKFIFIMMLCLALTACVDIRPKAPIDITDRSLSCVHEKPLSKGELYARGMQDYFKLRMNDILKSHEDINEEYDAIVGEYNPFYTKSCGILENADNVSHFASQVCFPYKITTYDTLDKLKQWHKHGIGTTDYMQLISKYWQGKAFDPYQDMVYKPEWYNHAADFAIVQHIGHTITYYPKDCCKLMDFNEINQAREWASHHYRENEQLYKPFYFLKIDSITVDVIEEPNQLNYLKNPKSKEFLELLEDNYHSSSIYAILNHCGNIVR